MGKRAKGLIDNAGEELFPKNSQGNFWICSEIAACCLTKIFGNSDKEAKKC